MLSPAQWCSSVQLLQLASLCLHGTHLNYMTKMIIILCFAGQLSIQSDSVNRQWKYVTEGFSLYSGRARCLPPTLKSLTLRKIASSTTLFWCRVCCLILLALNSIHSEPCDTSPAIYIICMHVAVRVLHSCTFIAFENTFCSTSDMHGYTCQ